MDAEGNRQLILSADFARTHDFVGFDDRGRVVTKSGRDGRLAIDVTDLESGRAEYLYP